MGEQTLKMRHVLAAMVTNEPGVLAQVAGMFAARGFNIDSLVVGRTENPEISRMTIVVNGDDGVLEQVRKQLQKLVPVVKVVDYKSVSVVERDLLLLLVSTSGEISSTQGSMDANNDAQVAIRNHERSELIELANLFRAKVVDVGVDRLMIELSGTEDKIEAFIELARPYGILELARTGVIAMPRGLTSSLPGAAPGASNAGPTTTVDESDLPPG